jgi:hypothetical protein
MPFSVERLNRSGRPEAALRQKHAHNPDLHPVVAFSASGRVCSIGAPAISRRTRYNSRSQQLEGQASMRKRPWPCRAAVEHGSLTTLREKLVKIGARIVRHGRYAVFQLAEVAVPRSLFADILRRIDDLRPRPPPLPA